MSSTIFSLRVSMPLRNFHLAFTLEHAANRLSRPAHITPGLGHLFGHGGIRGRRRVRQRFRILDTIQNSLNYYAVFLIQSGEQRGLTFSIENKPDHSRQIAPAILVGGIQNRDLVPQLEPVLACLDDANDQPGMGLNDLLFLPG
jgi:hypothetical protein